MTGSQLDLWSYERAVAVPSDSGEGNHLVERTERGYTCTCNAYHYSHGSDCKHILKVKLEAAQREIDSYRALHQEIPKATFDSIQQLTARLVTSDHVELANLMNIITDFIIRTGRVTADDVYEAVGGYFISSSKVLGVAFKVMADRGDIVVAYYEPSRRKSSHGRRIGVWVKRE